MKKMNENMKRPRSTIEACLGSEDSMDIYVPLLLFRCLCHKPVPADDLGQGVAVVLALPSSRLRNADMKSRTACATELRWQVARIHEFVRLAGRCGRDRPAEAGHSR